MTATPAPQGTPPRPRSSWSAGRIVALVFGLLLLLPGLGLVLGGGLLLAADVGGRSDGFVFSPTESFTSDGYALVSDRIDLSAGADWFPVSAALGTARVEVTGTGSSDVFIGIAPADAATAYLDGVQRTRIADLGFDQPARSTDQLPGGPPPGPPTEQDFWTTQASGPGTQQLTWEPAQGNWMLVVMNADGSAGVSTQARIGAEFPSLTGLAWGLLIGGLVLLALAVVLLVVAFRRRPEQQPADWSGPPPIPAPRTSAEAGAPSADTRPAPSGTEPPPPTSG